jgi:hypothetical protein
MQYLYKPIAEPNSTFVEANLPSEARKTLARGGWFVSFSALPGIAIVSLNTNYWYNFGATVSPPQPALAAEQLDWLCVLATSGSIRSIVH